MNRGMFRAGILLGAVAVLAVFSAVYVVSENEETLVLRFGRPIAVEKTPGLKLKYPFIDTVNRYDRRLLDLEAPTELIILGDQKRIEIDSYTEFRIADPLRFSQSVQTLEQGRSRLVQIVSTTARRVLGEVDLPSLLSPKREAIIGSIRAKVAETAQPLGIEVVDVNIRRADLPPETSQAIYDRMTSERQREATELRAQGYEWAQQVTAKADRARTVLLSEAELKARIARAEGDAEASRLYAEAFGKNLKFFEFYRAMESYRRGLAEAAPTLVLTPDAQMLRYFNGNMPGVGLPGGAGVADDGAPAGGGAGK